MLKSKKIKISFIESAIKKRDEARTLKNYRVSDEIRDELFYKGIELQDNPDGSTSWTVRI